MVAGSVGGNTSGSKAITSPSLADYRAQRKVPGPLSAVLFKAISLTAPVKPKDMLIKNRNKTIKVIRSKSTFQLLMVLPDLVMFTSPYHSFIKVGLSVFTFHSIKIPSP